MKQYDVAVVGGGPAGASAAYRLARAGLKVALIEKESLPRRKVCAGGVVFRARSMFDVDITPVVESECFTASLCLLKSGSYFEAVRDVPVISMVMRARLDQFLCEQAVQAGADMYDSFCVVSADFEHDFVTVRSEAGAIRAGHVIAADGASSTMARLAGWQESARLAPAIECELTVSDTIMDRFANRAHFDFDIPANGYGWVFPKRDHLNIGLGGFGRKKKLNLKALLHEYTDLLGIRLPADVDIYGYVIPVVPRAGGFVRNRVFLVGDAAGFADPVSAEGISFSLQSGQLAADALIESGLDAVASQNLYQDRLEHSILPELAAGRKLATLFYSSRYLREWLMKHYGPRLTEAVADVYTGKRTYSSAADTFLQRMRQMGMPGPEGRAGEPG
ncbi:MAG: geranylgeranyl reductase family protein [Mariprofundaceae bacterium]|nr:geranylgeranyl reductase family protein [Mariprofundaceae bacterium]